MQAQSSSRPTRRAAQVAASLAVVTTVSALAISCGDSSSDDAGAAGTGGAAGAAGAAGLGGAGQSGNAGAAGLAGSAGAAGLAGNAGAAGLAGNAGAAGQSGNAGAAGQSGAGGTAGQAGSAGSGGQGGAAGTGGSGVAYRSFLMIERWVRTDPAASHTIAATVTFHQDSPPPMFADIDEHCGYHDGYWVPSGPKEPGFGPITLVAPKLGTVTFPSASGYEPAGGVLGWDAGDKLKLTAPGGDLPGFDLEDEVPAPVTVTSVDLASLKANQLAIDRTKPYPLTWVPVSTEVFVLFLQFVDAAYPLRGVLCFFPGQTGAAELPTAVLGHLMASKDVPMTNLYISGASRKKPSLAGVKLEMVTWNGRAARIQVQ